MYFVYDHKTQTYLFISTVINEMVANMEIISNRQKVLEKILDKPPNSIGF